jgi:hypothetical protein
MKGLQIQRNNATFSDLSGYGEYLFPKNPNIRTSDEFRPRASEFQRQELELADQYRTGFAVHGDHLQRQFLRAICANWCNAIRFLGDRDSISGIKRRG